MQRQKSRGDGRTEMKFEKDYFSGRRYKGKEKLVKRNVLEVVKWASRVADADFSRGRGKRALDVG
jgi:hypothetical protein